MLRLFAVLLSLVLAALGRAQERTATVELDNGQVLTGRVISMDQATLAIQVGAETVKVPATRIRSCHFEEVASPAAVAVTASPEVVATPAPPEPANVAQAAPVPPVVRRTGPLPEPVDTEAPVVPHDLRGRSLWRSRLETVDAAYPWLVPTVFAQWISLGLLLSVGLALIVHTSTRVCGVEGVSLGRSQALALWYVLTAILQTAMVPSGNLATVLVLMLNPTIALFWLCSLFGLSRGAALIAYAVQLGFLALGYGLLELVTSILGSVSVDAS